ncbi:MAG: type II secretion system F family protein, partial [Hyphomicrobiales bacterium]|nr:type II secretion system F family protein [Hyphomicrobiales bacterium]
MKAVSTERDKIRMREREKMAERKEKGTLRTEPKALLRQFVESFNLAKWLGTENAKNQLAMAGYRGRQAEMMFLAARAILPIALFLGTLLYVFVLGKVGYPPPIKIAMAVGGAYVGIKLPEVFLSNVMQKRQQSIKRAFPDALDLLLICVESGMSIEQSFRKVAQEIGAQSVPLAEELQLTTAELSFLPDRRQALENFSSRTGLDVVKQIVTVLIQAEKYGTPLGQALRVVSQESRDTRMMEAEQKAASLPPKLTVPMIVFFLPVLFAVI